jgi:5-methylcytosine-specific restriction protein B
MSIYNPNRKVTPIYNAAASWKDHSLLMDRSVLTEGKNLWTSVLLAELDQRFVRNLDVGEGDFLSKLKVQLSDGSPDCRQLMAECLWLLLLFPSNVGAAKKREIVLEIWSWSNEELDASHPLIADAVLKGIGSAGTAYNTHRWRELVFLIGALRDFKVRDVSDRDQILSVGFRAKLSRLGA